MKLRILTGALALTLLTGTALAAKGDATQLLRSFGGGAVPDGTPTVTFSVSIAPNDTTTACAAQPAPTEPVISLAVGPNAVITGTGWNTTQTAFAPSWLSELTIQYYNNVGAQVAVNPGFGNDAPGGPTNFTSGGVLDLTDNGLPNIQIGADGILRLGLCEGFLDNANPDGRFSAPSTITIACNNCVDPSGPPPGADLALTQTNNQSGALLIGSTFQKTLTVTNNGPSAATAITVSDTLPSQLTFVSSTCGATAVGQVVTYMIPTLANGAVNNCAITVSVNSNGTIVNTASITASTPADPAPANNTTSQQIGPTGGGIAQTAVPALDAKSILVLLGLVSLFGAIALRQRNA